MKQKVLQYDAVFEKETDGGYSVWIPDLPGCTSQGGSLEEAMENIKEAMELYLEEADDDKVDEGTMKQLVTVPNHKVIRKGTLLNGILKPINLTLEEFKKLL